jgi:two-component system invasion response regulator UvrY
LRRIQTGIEILTVDGFRKRGNCLSYAPRILIVDDEPSVRALFEEVLSGDGYYITAVGTARQAMRTLRDFEFDLVILDMSLPDRDGAELLGHIRSESPHLRILAASGFMAGGMHDIAISAGATATLAKPTTPHELRQAVYQLLDSSCTWMGTAT